MEKKTEIGRIESISEKQGSTNGKAWVNFTVAINEKKYGTFDADMVKPFKAGDVVEIALEKEAESKYWKMMTITASTQKVPSQASAAQNGAVGEVIKGILINKTENANSFEFGKAGSRFKIYFETAADLKAKIESLKELGLYSEELPSIVLT
jgi:hypothetical protein